MASTISIADAGKRVRVIRRLTQTWLLFLILGSLQPSRPPGLVGLHRELHWLAFAGASILLLLLARNLSDAICRAVAAFVLGFSLEWVQHLMYHRGIEWLDMIDDGGAILAAFAIYWFALRPGAAKEVRS